MQGKLSRRKIAQYVAERVRSGLVPEQVMQEVAAYLVETRRVREAALVARAIEDALYEQGTAVCHESRLACSTTNCVRLLPPKWVCATCTCVRWWTQAYWGGYLFADS